MSLDDAPKDIIIPADLTLGISHISCINGCCLLTGWDVSTINYSATTLEIYGATASDAVTAIVIIILHRIGKLCFWVFHNFRQEFASKSDHTLLLLYTCVCCHSVRMNGKTIFRR